MHEWQSREIKLFTAPMRNYNEKEIEDSGSDLDALTLFCHCGLLFPTAELIRPINNQHMAHFLPRLNKKLNQYWISSNPLILFSLNECALLWCCCVKQILTCCSLGWRTRPYWWRLCAWRRAFKEILVVNIKSNHIKYSKWTAFSVLHNIFKIWFVLLNISS